MTLTSLISLLGHCKSTRQLRQTQAHLVVSSLSGNAFLHPSILSSSSSSSSSSSLSDHKTDYPLLLLNSIRRPTPPLYNALIRACAHGPNPSQALAYFADMLRLGLGPNHLTFPFLAKSCARIRSLSLGQTVHSHIMSCGLDSDRFISNSLTHMYASCGLPNDARKVFDRITQPNIVSWNTMISGYAKCGEMASAREMFRRMPTRNVVSWSALMDGYVRSGKHREALALFKEMLAERIVANSVTMVSVVSACAQLGALEEGRRMHRYAEENAVGLSLALGTSLVDMYAKCGAIEEAARVFHSFPPLETDVLIWNAMIGAFAAHGMCTESLGLFAKMRELGIVPDEITYLSLLSACARGGRVSDAWALLRDLESRGIVPHVEHYASMVDVLGRSGCIEEACELIRSMPMEPSASVLGALLNGCRMHGKAKLGEEIARKLIEMRPHEDGRYVGLSSVYASLGRWSDARMARRAMEKRGVKKVYGCSSVVEVV